MSEGNVSAPWSALAGGVEEALGELRGQLARHERGVGGLGHAVVGGRAADFKEAFVNAGAVHQRQRRQFEQLLDEARQKIDRLAATAPDGAARVRLRRSTFVRRFDAIWPWPDRPLGKTNR